MRMHEKYMRLAIEEAKKGEGFANPNPLVGAVIVKKNKILGIGYHKKYGENHAEINDSFKFIFYYRIRTRRRFSVMRARF